MEKILNYINGELIGPLAGKHLENYDPSAGKVYSVLPDSDEHDVAKAVDAATQAFKGWSLLSAESRCVILQQIAELIDRDLDKLALAESIDNGKPLGLAKVM